MNGREWDEYIEGAGVDHKSFRQSRDRFRAALTVQRTLAQGLLSSGGVRSVAWLGAGYQNDVPIDALVKEGIEFHFVDWIPNLAEQGFRWSLIREESGIFSCEACVNGRDGLRYCGAFQPPIRVPHEVCGHFAPSALNPVWCTAYVPGARSRFPVSDITGGRARYFASRAAGVVERAKSGADAVRQLLALVRTCRRVDEPVGVPERSIDLAVSSLVISQFDVEPFGFALSRLAARFGAEGLARRAAKLEPLLQKLRRELYETLVEGHARAIARLLRRPLGRVYVAAECFRSETDDGPFFIVEGTLKAFEILGRHFWFQFDAIPAEQVVNWTALKPGAAMVANHVLQPM